MPGSKVCVVLGAGASYDVRNIGSPDAFPAIRPPLANGLFNMETNPLYFDTIMEPYPRAKVLSQIIAPRAAAGTETIETELARLARHDDLQTSQDFKEIPAYLRDLLQKSSRDYTSLPGHYIQLAHLLLKDYGCEVLFLVMNYDDLLEQALTYIFPEFQFTKMSDYVDGDRPFKVVKLHGSINWFTTLSENEKDDWSVLVARHDIFARIPENEIVVYGSLTRTSRWLGARNRYVYPLITAPVASEDKSPVCPDSHYEAAKSFLDDCDKFLVIGTAAMDQDLLDLINESVNPKSNPLLHVVDKTKTDSTGRLIEASPATGTTQRLRDGINIFSEGNLVEPSTLFDGGFGAYINSDAVKRFADRKG